MSEIRISCASFGSIMIEDKYLLLMNKKSYKEGNIIYTPVGGALEYLPEGKLFLDSLGARYERKTPDLRFFMDENNLDLFQYWFERKIDRETDAHRELKEELVDEENILDSLETSDYKSHQLCLVKDKRMWKNNSTHYFFEIWNISFSQEKIDQIIKALDSQKVILATESEIKNGITQRGQKISAHSNSILI